MEISVKDNAGTIEKKFKDCNSKNNLQRSATDASIASIPQKKNTFCCERCNIFETDSKASLLLHVVHCLPNLKIEDPDGGNLSITATERSSVRDGAKLADLQPLYCAESHLFNSSASSTNEPTSMQSTRKLFECDVCNMKFSNGANMRRHKMRHTGVKPYECRVCQKRFFRKDHLAEHFTTHTKTLPYHCPICSRGFQRQIAMRAHFQNEHVGQHDLIKTCPLCTYRAGSMKSLRIHFFNRHGIDLDNPGASGPSSLLLALESHASHIAANTESDVGFVPDISSVAAAAALISSKNLQSLQTDSKAQRRLIENVTPPMHLLTPHVEISTLASNEHEVLNENTTVIALGEKPSQDEDKKHSVESLTVPTQIDSSDCNIKLIPSSANSPVEQRINMSKTHNHDNQITPSISLIPIKQESIIEAESSKSSSQENSSYTDKNSGENCGEFSLNSKKFTSLIKVSPLKSLLREDLKRRICVKANNRITRNIEALENNNVIQNVTPALNTPICNGTITSTGQDSETSLLYNKQILTCLFCGIEFPDETLYFLHKGCHCESNPWKCNICSEQCNNVYEFNSHLLSKSHQ